MKSSLLIIACVFLLLSDAPGQKYEANWASIDSRPVPQWFPDAKFGIFIHWGVYSVPSWAPTGREFPVYSKYAEWYWRRLTDTSATGRAFAAYHSKIYGGNFRYEDFAKEFKAALFDPYQWADVFASSGARYVVLTSKHHEGFTLWPSQQSPGWNSVEVGSHRDLAGDLSKAVKEKGLHMGFYYSLYEWFNPLYHTDVNKYVDEHMIPQMKDLVTRYKPDILWTDGEWEYTSETWKSTEFLSWLFNESDSKDAVVVNDRWGKETRSKHGGIYTTEYDLIHDANANDKVITHPWEECRGIGSSFGYNRAENLADYSTSQQLINTLIEKVARGGNLLLDIGPTSDGRIPVIMQQRLADIGAWLRVNGEAVYSSSRWDLAPPVKKDTEVFFTKKNNDLYVFCTRFPAKEIVIGNIRPNKHLKISMLGSGKTIAYRFQNSKLTIKAPLLTPADNPSNYAWVFKVENGLE